MLCTIGCTYNAYEIVSSYLAYQVAAEAWFFSVEPITPPVIILCIKNNFRNFQNATLINSTKSYFESSYNFSDVVSFLAIHKQPDGMVIIDEYEDFQKYYVQTFSVHWKVCYAVDISLFNNSVIAFTNDYVRSLTWRTMFEMDVNATACSHSGQPCEVMLSQPLTYYTDPIGNVVIHGYENFIENTLTKLNLLPHPYITRCRDYASEGLVTQEDCFIICSRQLTLKLYELVSTQTPFFPNKNIGIFRGNLDQNVTKVCKSECSQIACQLTQYTVEVDTQALIEKNTTKVIIVIPKTSRILINYIPKIDFWGFLICLDLCLVCGLDFLCLDLLKRFFRFS